MSILLCTVLQFCIVICILLILASCKELMFKTKTIPMNHEPQTSSCQFKNFIMKLYKIKDNTYIVIYITSF